MTQKVFSLVNFAQFLGTRVVFFEANLSLFTTFLNSQHEHALFLGNLLSPVSLMLFFVYLPNVFVKVGSVLEGRTTELARVWRSAGVHILVVLELGLGHEAFRWVTVSADEWFV